MIQPFCRYDPPTLAVTTNTADASYDSVVVVTDSTDKLTGTLSNLKTIVDNYISVWPPQHILLFCLQSHYHELRQFPTLEFVVLYLRLILVALPVLY